jgi:periplasmic protein TonB
MSELEEKAPFYEDALDEIVFADRHKEYGAYALRKEYKKFVNRSVLVGVGLMLIIVLIPFFIWTQTLSADSEREVMAEMMDLAMDKKEEAPPPPPPPPEQVMEEKAKFTAPVVVLDTTETTDISQDDLTQKVTNVAVDDNFEDLFEDDAADEVIEQVIETPVFTVVEEMPSFPGGDEARIKFLTENIKYPQMAKETGIQGTVYVTFTTDERGRVTDVQLQRGIGGGCDEEAIRVVKMMPPWVPGKQNGKPVRVRFTMQIKFTLN